MLESVIIDSLTVGELTYAKWRAIPGTIGAQKIKLKLKGCGAQGA